MDNFKGQVTGSVKDLLEDNNIHIAFVPPNTTDLLQPLDVLVNKPAKCFLRQKFDAWYASEIFKQLDNTDDGDMEPVDMCLPVMKELFSKWIVEMHKYIASNSQFIVNEFTHTGITKALDGDLDSDSEDNLDEYSTQSTSEDSESANRTENMPKTETVIVECNSEDMVIEDDTAQSIGSNPQLQSGT